MSAAELSIAREHARDRVRRWRRYLAAAGAQTRATYSSDAALTAIAAVNLETCAAQLLEALEALEDLDGSAP